MTDDTPLRRIDTPFRLNLEQQKKRAKDLLKAVLDGAPDALARFVKHHPKTPQTPRLADAQLVIARELGLPSWPRLKAHIADMNTALARIESGVISDAGMKLLHLRCGSDIRQALTLAGFSGDFLEYADPFVRGPVTAAPDWLDQRARFIAGHYDRSFDATRKGLGEEEEALAAARHYDRVVIWMEHDCYDQLILSRYLAQFHEGGAPKVLELATIDRFPGGACFLGLGQLPPEGLLLVWRDRKPITPAELALGHRFWTALRQPDPGGLAALTGEEDGLLPFMRPAFRRHLQELPWVGDGLSLTERLALRIIAEAGEITFARTFREFLLNRETLAFNGDLAFHDDVSALIEAREPAVRITGDADKDWPKRRLQLTDVGRALLERRRDWLACGPGERWIGGVHIRAGEPAWRWDDAAGRPVLSGG